MKISVAIAYYNRKELFRRTLSSIAKTKHTDFEVIAVDDCSLEEERIEDLMTEFPFLRVVRVELVDKWYNSANVPWNQAIAESDGDIIILQNPESYHVCDVLEYVAGHTDDSNYISMATYSISEEMLEDFAAQIDTSGFLDWFMNLPHQAVVDYVGWYNHTEHNPTHFSFCAALSRKSMEKIGGFDERFAMGIGYEDNDMVMRIERAGIHKVINNSTPVIHQWHPKVYDIETYPEHAILWNLNATLFSKVRFEKGYKVTNRFEK